MTRGAGTRIKICGITRAVDATAAVGLGADFLGLNFWPGSKRFLDARAAPAVVGAAHVPGINGIGGQ